MGGGKVDAARCLKLQNAEKVGGAFYSMSE